jgi:hypothetical protein
MYLLGHEAEFGYQEAVKLLSSSKLPEKFLVGLKLVLLFLLVKGYITCGVVLYEDHPMVSQVIPAFKADLESNYDINVCMALAGASSIGGKLLADALVPTVNKLVGYAFFL